MATKFPYVPSAGPLVKTIAQLRRSFPKEVNAETLRKLGVAPKNESYVIGVLRFLGVLDEEGKRVNNKSQAFLQGDESFQAAFADIVHDAYDELFETCLDHGPAGANRHKSVNKAAGAEVCGRYIGYAVVEIEKTKNRNGGLFMLAGLRFVEDGRLGWTANWVAPFDGTGLARKT